MRDRPAPPGYGPGVEDPYRPYVPYDDEVEDDAPARDHAPRARLRHGFAILHDGNVGHFWRGEVFSRLAEAMLITGMLLWIAILTYSPPVVALAVVALALPWLLAGPLAVPAQNVAVPGRALRVVGQARVLLALGVVLIQLIHYRGIFPSALYPILFLLLFAIAFCGRLRDGLRVAATRVCLAPGELELVANDLQIGSAVVAVVGPLLATLFFVFLGERILLVAIAAAVVYFISANSEGLLEALPVGRRAFSWVTLERAVEDDRLRAELLEAAQPEDRQPAAVLDADTAHMEAHMLAERALPEWYQQGPRSVWQGIAELRAGLGLAAIANSSSTSLYVLGSLSLIGGGLTVLEVFYVLYVLQVPIFYLGALLAVEAGGLALGGVLAAGRVEKGSWRFPIVAGLVGSGVALAIWGLWPSLPVALFAALLLGVANAFAVMGARRGVRIGYNGPERRALTVAEGFVCALCAIAGAGIFVFFYLYLSPTYQPLAQVPILSRFTLGADFTGWALGDLFLLSGLLLVFLSIGFGMSLLLGRVGPRRIISPLVGPAPGGVGLRTAERMAFPATGGLATVGYDDDWDDDTDAPRYEPGYVPGYGRGASYSRGETGYQRGYGYDDRYDDGDEDDGGW